MAFLYQREGRKKRIFHFSMLLINMILNILGYEFCESIVFPRYFVVRVLVDFVDL